jgi:hypothetical protein
MSKQYDVKRRILKLIENPEDKELAAELLLEAIDSDEEDFEYENGETAEEYLFG